VDGTADQGGGPDYNTLTSGGAEALEPLSGMSVLNGIHVRIAPVRTSEGRDDDEIVKARPPLAMQ
jgi:hypothetical protein